MGCKWSLNDHIALIFTHSSDEGLSSVLSLTLTSYNSLRRHYVMHSPYYHPLHNKLYASLCSLALRILQNISNARQHSLWMIRCWLLLRPAMSQCHSYPRTHYLIHHKPGTRGELLGISKNPEGSCTTVQCTLEINFRALSKTFLRPPTRTKCPGITSCLVVMLLFSGWLWNNWFNSCSSLQITNVLKLSKVLCHFKARD